MYVSLYTYKDVLSDVYVMRSYESAGERKVIMCELHMVELPHGKVMVPHVEYSMSQGPLCACTSFVSCFNHTLQASSFFNVLCSFSFTSPLFHLMSSQFS